MPCLACALGDRGPHIGSSRTDAFYCFRRAAVRLIDLLHVGLFNAVSTSAVARQEEGPWLRTGWELTVLISVLGAVLILLPLLRLIAQTPVYRVALNRLALPAALFAMPACYLCVSMTIQPIYSPGLHSPPGSLWHSPLMLFFAAEVLCAGVLAVVHRVRALPAWAIGSLAALHFAFWFPVIWIGMPDWTFRLVAPRLLLTALPLSGAASLLYLKTPRRNATGTGSPRSRDGKWTLAYAVISLALLVAMWPPGWARGIAHPRDIRSVAIELSRGPCFGSCPSYRVAIHGSGLVEYSAEQTVRVGGQWRKVSRQDTGKVSSERIAQLLRDLDRIRFFAIEDRAFQWCFDTPSAGVSVSIDGRTKSVVGDSSCVGSKSGVQARFVAIAAEIDSMTGARNWATCGGLCRQ